MPRYAMLSVNAEPETIERFKANAKAQGLTHKAYLIRIMEAEAALAQHASEQAAEAGLARLPGPPLRASHASPDGTEPPMPQAKPGSLLGQPARDIRLPRANPDGTFTCD